MKYQELKKILRKAAKEKRVVDAFVTFTPGSFLKAYTQLERTYLFTSNNKAFASPSCSGYSIFGDCMDGQDSGVRLERYMAEKAARTAGKSRTAVSSNTSFFRPMSVR